MANSLARHTATHCNTLQHIATHCNILLQQGMKKVLVLAADGKTHCPTNTLQHTAAHCNTLQHTALHCNILQHTTTAGDEESASASSRWQTHCPDTLQTHCPDTLQHTATRYDTLQHTATRGTTGAEKSASAGSRWQTYCCDTLQTHCPDTLQHAATRCNTLQHTASHCNTLQQQGLKKVLALAADGKQSLGFVTAQVRSLLNPDPTIIQQVASESLTVTPLRAIARVSHIVLICHEHYIN